MSEINEVIHTPGRLRIMTALASLEPGDTITFPRLRELLDMTAGNLSRHLEKLDDHHYVAITRTIRHRKTVTTVALTPTGRAAYDTYLTELRQLLAGGTEHV